VVQALVGEPPDQFGDLGTKQVEDLVVGGVGVLDGVVEVGGGHRGAVVADLADNVAHLNQMVEVGLAGVSAGAIIPH
jgi:hypothetical protein